MNLHDDAMTTAVIPQHQAVLGVAVTLQGKTVDPLTVTAVAVRDVSTAAIEAGEQWTAPHARLVVIKVADLTADLEAYETMALEGRTWRIQHPPQNVSTARVTVRVEDTALMGAHRPGYRGG